MSSRKKKATPQTPLLDVFMPDVTQRISLPLFQTPVSAGFPSPADDYEEKKLDLNEYLVSRPSSTFFVKVSGQSMTGAGIHDGDLLIVDRSATVADKKIVIGVVNGEFTVKRIRKKGTQLFLEPENPAFKPIEITGDMDFTIWGVVTYVIHKV
ncbi:MAG: translesion error-prone DNA polymerase V autoproteolytic subunit [Bacteroidetes bacterium]|nr:translesion error-prone DNA polymerase V autoproteolytic subunit [Bacteroidota bacterium]